MATQGIKRKRSAYDASFKLKVVDHAEIHGNRAASREFTVPETNVREWRKQKVVLKDMNKTKKAQRGRQAMYPDMEKELYEWIIDQRSSGYIVTSLHIRLQAQKFCKDSNFKASNGWTQKFMKRHGLAIRQRTKIAQKLPNDLEEKIASFHTFIINQRKQINFELSQIGNMDETPMWFDLPANRTIDSKGKHTVQIRTTGHEKTHFTVVLSCMADGFKLKPMVIFKRKTIPKGVKFPPGVVIHCHPKGWMDEKGIILWLNKVWITRPGALLKKSMLVWDQFRSHLTDTVKDKLKSLKTFQAVIPGGLTSILQPLDVVLNKPFKDRVREKWITWMKSDDKELTAKGNLKKPGLSLVTSWVKTSWEDIPKEMIIKSFLKTGISNKMDGTEDDLLWNSDSEESEETGETDVPANWDTDETLTREEWEQLFSVSDDESDFEAF